MDIRQKIKSAPDAAGVYLMKDAQGRVIYIGKAKSLKKRLMTYLGQDMSSKTLALMQQVDDIEYRICVGEKMALLLEAGLIHKYKPKYNVSLRDDKSFPFVKITNEDFPAIYITRRRENDSALYLGPYTNAKLLREALKIIRRSFPYRSCKILPKKACIYYRLKLSPAPCVGKISSREYADTIRNISFILQGKSEELIKELSIKMHKASRLTSFEEAVQFRDQILALKSLGEDSFGSEDDSSDLKSWLGLKKIPKRIETFDVSNIFGQEAVASMVSFYKGKPDKNNYRRFRIKSVGGIDDYQMLREAVRRRYTRLKNESIAMPDLIILDGGRAHLLSAENELKSLDLDIPMLAIAKEEENIYILGRKTPIHSASDRPGLNLIRYIRDEAHRFALAYHHILRRKKIIGK